MNLADFAALIGRVLGDGTWPKPYHTLQGLMRVRGGEDPATVARDVGTIKSRLQSLAQVQVPEEHIFGLRFEDVSETRQKRAAQMLGQLLLGRCAEIAFEEIYRLEMRPGEFDLRDVREGRTDTDYRLHNGGGRPVYRINIKFHGSAFRRARELVGLDPMDCFALATYKIYSALKKQTDEGLPYFFAIVGVPTLTGAAVGAAIPSELVEAAAYIDQAPKASSKRDLEDAMISVLVEEDHPAFIETLSRIQSADWYILSARRAEKLLHEKLFERVFAMTVRNFTRMFPGAELDMHYSLSQDLTPLRTFLSTLKGGGSHKITTLLERGEY